MNSFGVVFRVTLFGESHGPAIGVIIDGCPPGIAVKTDDFMTDLKRRQSGSKGTTKRQEPDLPEILSGVFNGVTTGAPITLSQETVIKFHLIMMNLKMFHDPGHADFVSQYKVFRFFRYARKRSFFRQDNMGIVAAGVIAKKIAESADISCKAYFCRRF